ncbi:MAG: RluA family pseudouridine synthase [Eubacteriales bacterium]|nr:RluA family pseudouridine synthase [Eubacteriales bacterium]
MRSFTIGKNDCGQRLDKFISKAMPKIPSSLVYKSIRTKKIKVNRKRATPSQILLEGDSLQLFLPEEFFDVADNVSGTKTLEAVRADIDVIYEDRNIILVNKPADVPVHEDDSNNNNNLIVYIQSYLYKKGEYSPLDENSFSPALCNRIDRNTSGIVIAAKNAEALREMNALIKERSISKFYLAAVHGIMEKKSDTLTAYLVKNEKTNTVKVFDDARPGTKKIVTKYRTLAEKNGLSLIEAELVTGRTHQIRAHMAHIGHPLLGDGKYGINRKDRDMGYKHQALCSYRLVFGNYSSDSFFHYLSGREFSVPENRVYFLSLF